MTLKQSGLKTNTCDCRNATRRLGDDTTTTLARFSNDKANSNAQDV